MCRVTNEIDSVCGVMGMLETGLNKCEWQCELHCEHGLECVRLAWIEMRYGISYYGHRMDFWIKMHGFSKWFKMDFYTMYVIKSKVWKTSLDGLNSLNISWIKSNTMIIIFIS